MFKRRLDDFFDDGLIDDNYVPIQEPGKRFKKLDLPGKRSYPERVLANRDYRREGLKGSFDYNKKRKGYSC